MQSISLLFKVLWSPGEAFFLIAKSPRVLAPVLFLSLFSLLTGLAVTMKLDSAELAMRAINQSPRGAQMTDEQKAQIRQAMSSPVMKVFTLTTAVIGPLIMIALITGLYFGVFTMLGREGGFKAFLSITAYACIPTIFRQLATVMSAFVVPVESIMPDELGSLSPAVFLNRDGMSPVLFAAVNMIDLVTIWILVLLTIGYGFVTRKSLSKVVRASVVVGVFLVYVVLRLGIAALRGV